MATPKENTKSVEASEQDSIAVNGAGQKPGRPLIFISHDHRDAKLAELFANLLTDASGGFLKSFRSSDRKGTAGIEFGAEWYSDIMGKISDATDVVALLTTSSIDRPWILYEAGVAKGKLDKPVFGIVVNVSFDLATKGPFAQFQNCGADEDSLTKLVLQLIKRNSDAEPREEAVRRQVGAFIESIPPADSNGKTAALSTSPDGEASSAAKLFEEIKVMFRDLPDRLQGQLNESLGPRTRRRRRFHPVMFIEMLHHPSTQEQGGHALAWLAVISFLRDDAPWLYELGLDVYRALQTDDDLLIMRAIDSFEKSLHLARTSVVREYMIDSPDVEMAVNELGRTLRLSLTEGAAHRRAKPRPKSSGMGHS